MLQHGHCAFLLFCFSKNQKTSFFSFFTFSSRKYSLVLIKNVLLGTYSSFGFSKCALKGQQRLASEATPWVKARSLVTPCKGRSFK